MRHRRMGALAVGAAMLAVPVQAEETARSDAPIVIIGKRLDDSERALAECLARKCPPMEDMTASLTHAENQFVAGEYQAARATLSRSLGRNRGHAREYPVAVSGLYRAHSRISIHMGEGEDYENSALGSARALRAGLPETDPRVLIGQFDVARMYSNLGEHYAAMRTYSSIARQAWDVGATDVAGLAEIRGAWIAYQFGRDKQSKKRLISLASETDPKLRSVAIAAKILLARMDKAEGGSGFSNALISELAGLSSTRMLVYGPPIEPTQAGVLAKPGGGSAIVSGNPSHFSKAEDNRETWVDVGFRILPDGSVEDAEILRNNGNTAWTSPVLSAIGQRRYTPSDGVKEDYRVERYSYTSLKIQVAGSRIPQHSTNYRIEQIDLTAN